MLSFLNGIVTLAAVLGIAAAGLALFGRWFTLPAIFTGPTICRLEAGGCQVLFRTEEASLLGVPNSLLGILFYTFLMSAPALHVPVWLMLLGASTAFGMTVSLSHLLISRHLECRICWTGHAVNTLIWIALILKVSIARGNG